MTLDQKVLKVIESIALNPHLDWIQKDDVALSYINMQPNGINPFLRTQYIRYYFELKRGIENEPSKRNANSK